MLDSWSHRFENNSSVVGEVCHRFLFVEEPTVSLVETVRKVPVEKRDHGDDAGSDENRPPISRNVEDPFH